MEDSMSSAQKPERALFEDCRTVLYLISVWDSVNILLHIGKWRSENDFPEHENIVFFSFFPMLQIMAHGVEIGLKWCCLLNGRKENKPTHEFCPLWRDLPEIQRQSIESYYSCNSKEKPRQDIQQVLKCFSSLVTDSRYIVEGKSWDKMSRINKSSEIHIGHFMDVFEAVVHEACRIGADIKGVRLLEFPSFRTEMKEYGGECYSQTGTFAALKTGNKKTFKFDYKTLLKDLL